MPVQVPVQLESHMQWWCVLRRAEGSACVLQLADSTEVMQRIKRAPGVKYPALTPNLKVRPGTGSHQGCTARQCGMVAEHNMAAAHIHEAA